MRYDILTLFPETFSGFLSQSILHRAIQQGRIEVKLWDIREWSCDKHKTVDDRPFGGGAGMVLMCDPVFRCVEHVQSENQPGRLIMLTPQGRRLKQPLVEQLAGEDRLIMLCGRYEGFDDRIRTGLKPLEISVGDYVLCGGEVPAMLLVEATARMLDGVLGDEQSNQEESFSKEGLIEYPQFTRPRDYRGMKVPDVLLGGNHQEIADWRKQQAIERTRKRRPDLLSDS